MVYARMTENHVNITKTASCPDVKHVYYILREKAKGHRLLAVLHVCFTPAMISYVKISLA